MKLSIDEVADALHLQLVNDSVVESEEVAPGVIVDYDAAGEIIGLEVFAFNQSAAPVDLMDFQFQANRKKAEISNVSSL